MINVGKTETGSPLMGYTKGDRRLYFLDNKLVGVAWSLDCNTQYACLPGVWSPDNTTQVVDQATLDNLAS